MILASLKTPESQGLKPWDLQNPSIMPGIYILFTSLDQKHISFFFGGHLFANIRLDTVQG